jgi:hypothetical protein
MSAHRSSAPLVVALLASACSDRSSPAPRPAPVVTNLGLAARDVVGTGELRLVLVPEADQGRDLDGDGDRLDHVVHVVDLASGAVLETGLAMFVPSSRSDPVPPLVASVGEVLAFGVSEHATGELDRNGDGDAFDLVLALYERETRTVTNLGIAVSRVEASHDLVAFDVPEIGQGEDLDGDGVVHPRVTVTFVHDRRTGETWSTGVAGWVLGVHGEHVAIAAGEGGIAGDRNGDGDLGDWVFELHDARTRAHVPVGLALHFSLVGPERPVARGGAWAVPVAERSQGSQDLSGDGDALDVVTFVVEPASGTQVNLGELLASDVVAELGRFVLVGPWPSGPVTLWLYDPLRDRLVDTGWAGPVTHALGERLVLHVSEEEQAQDLDGDGALASYVTVILDPFTGEEEVIERDSYAFPLPGGLLLHVRESVTRDWNGDGDRDDWVLQAWDARTGRIESSDLAIVGLAAALGPDDVLVILSEAEHGEDSNGDGDELDFVLHGYDLQTRATTSLGIASFGIPYPGGARALVLVRESDQAADLEGDGDLDDTVLHLVELAVVAGG